MRDSNQKRKMINNLEQPRWWKIIKIILIFLKWIIVSKFVLAFFSFIFVLSIVTSGFVADHVLEYEQEKPIPDIEKLQEWRELIDLWSILSQVICISGIIICHFFIIKGLLNETGVDWNIKVSVRKRKRRKKR